MRRSEIIKGVQQIIEAIDESNFLDVMSGLHRLNEEKIVEITRALKTYAIKAHSFNRSAKLLAKQFTLDELESPAYWAKIMSSKDETLSYEVYQPLNRLSFFRKNLPSVIELLKQNYSPQKEVSFDSNRTKVLSIKVFEDDKVFSKPKRLRV